MLLENRARQPGAGRAEAMGFVVVIPARYASTRLPGKPLADIHGKPMVQHVVEKALQSGADRVIVATDDERCSRPWPLCRRCRVRGA